MWDRTFGFETGHFVGADLSFTRSEFVLVFMSHLTLDYIFVYNPWLADPIWKIQKLAENWGGGASHTIDNLSDINLLALDICHFSGSYLTLC